MACRWLCSAIITRFCFSLIECVTDHGGLHVQELLVTPNSFTETQLFSGYYNNNKILIMLRTHKQLTDHHNHTHYYAPQTCILNLGVDSLLHRYLNSTLRNSHHSRYFLQF